MRRRGFTLVEILVGMGVATIVLGMAFALFRFGVVSTHQTLAPNVGLQQDSRSALVSFIKEVQESVEIVRPPPGSTLNYFYARDKLNRILTVYPVINDAASQRAGRDIHDVHVYTFDYGSSPPAQNQRLLLSQVERIAFTTLSPGILQVHLTLHEQGKSYDLLTAIRSRNLAGEGQL